VERQDFLRDKEVTPSGEVAVTGMADAKSEQGTPKSFDTGESTPKQEKKGIFEQPPGGIS